MKPPNPCGKWQEPAEIGRRSIGAFYCGPNRCRNVARTVHPNTPAGLGILYSTPSHFRWPRTPTARSPFFVAKTAAGTAGQRAASRTGFGRDARSDADGSRMPFPSERRTAVRPVGLHPPAGILGFAGAGDRVADPERNAPGAAAAAPTCGAEPLTRQQTYFPGRAPGDTRTRGAGAFRHGGISFDTTAQRSATRPQRQPRRD